MCICVCVFLPCGHDSSVPPAPSHHVSQGQFGQQEESREEDGAGRDKDEGPHDSWVYLCVCVCACVCVCVCGSAAALDEDMSAGGGGVGGGGACLSSEPCFYYDMKQGHLQVTFINCE